LRLLSSKVLRTPSTASSSSSGLNTPRYSCNGVGEGVVAGGGGGHVCLSGGLLIVTMCALRQGEEVEQLKAFTKMLCWRWHVRHN
jgi:hypothetical protein